ncbi:MAG TPA: UvrD-helicase domain-containing protein, partial [Candidatus Limnocylindria bacterium]|nr:UvrD-helicase domain-containing protein [Candidatus Limnocylindria bacterium]
MTAPLTDEQRAAVEDRAGPLLLSANAGSGKTTVLVERIVAAVREDGVELPAILAITFTDKAAAELRSRVRARFAELGDHAAAREAERAAISTIHGFCAALLRSHPVAAGIDPRFSVIDEERADRLADRAFDDALGAVLDAGGEAALDALSPYRAEDLRAVVRFAHDALRVRGHAEPELPEPPPLPDPAAARDALAAACVDLAAELDCPDASESAQAAAEVVQECTAFLARLGDRVPARLELRGFDVKGNGQGLRCDAAQAYRDALTAYRRACWEPQAARTYASLRELVSEHGRRYAALKREHAALDFADLELRAHVLLAADPGLRERVAQRYIHVMVDEFQDTNPLQLAILALVAPGNLFAVGDEFQSIYGFRHADVGLFRALRTRREGEGRARALKRNFRSRAEVLHAIDLAFSDRLFGEGFVPLEPDDAAPPAAEPPVELMVCAKKGWEEADLGETLPAATAWRLAEARALADRVRALVDGGREPGEIVLLFRASTDMAVFERALEDRGIPTYLVGGRGFWSQRQVSDVVAYLAALANPRDDLRLYEVLASPMVTASSDALALVARAHGAGKPVVVGGPDVTASP